MIGTDGDTVVRPHGHPESLPTPLPEALTTFEPEFFVEWQVAEHEILTPARPEANSL